MTASWLADYKYRREFSVSHASGELTDYQQQIEIWKNSIWTEYTSNSGKLYQYNSQLTQYPNLLKIGSTYFMYFATRALGGNFDIGLATAASPTAEQGDWTFQSLVIEKGASGKWDETYVIPTSVLESGGTYYLFYEGSGNSDTYGPFCVGYATSADGYTWTKQSVDAPIFYKAAGDVWDNFSIGTPYVFLDGSTFYLFYHSKHSGDAADSLKIGYATSPNLTGGGTWTRYASNPVLTFDVGEWDSNWVGAVAIVPITRAGEKSYVMFYEGAATAGAWATRLGIATSKDLTNWSKYDANPYFATGTNHPYGTMMHTLYVEGNNYYLYYTILPATGITSIGLFTSTHLPSYLYKLFELDGDCQDDFDDIRVTDSTGSTLLKYYIEEYASGYYARLWIKFSTIGTSATTFYLYTGNASATSYTSGTDTFITFEDFEWGNDTDSLYPAGGSVVWTISTGAVVISTDQALSGTRSAKIAGGVSSSAITSRVASETVAIRYYEYREAANSDSGSTHGDGTKRFSVNMFSDNTLCYYDGSQHSVANVLGDTWEMVELRNFDWTAHTFDIYLNGLLVKSGADMYTNASFDDIFGIRSAEATAGDDVYFDNIIIRNWDAIEPVISDLELKRTGFKINSITRSSYAKVNGQAELSLNTVIGVR